MSDTKQMTAAELHDALQRITEHLVRLRDQNVAEKPAREPDDEYGRALNAGVIIGYDVALDAIWAYTRGEHGQAAGGDGS